MAYVMAAQVAAFGGLVYPLLRGFVAPDLLGFEVSTKAVVMSLVGGVGTLLGPLAGSAIITFLESLVGSYTERHLMVLGVIFIVFVIFLPDGLCGLSRRAFIAFSVEVDTGSPQKTRQTQENSRRKASP
jgi:branched-chain amino acid transport system permease protein